MPLKYWCSAPVATHLHRPGLCSPRCRNYLAGMTYQPYARVMSMPWTDRCTFTVLAPALSTAWKCSPVLYILTSSGNACRRKGSFTVVLPPETVSCLLVVAWARSTLLCSAHAWAATAAFRVVGDCSGAVLWERSMETEDILMCPGPNEIADRVIRAMLRSAACPVYDEFQEFYEQT